ncbi:hypothetical protein HPB47_020740, partial [Ixodes persulcatus]
LKMEAELRFQSTMVTMLGKLEELKRAFCGDDPTTFFNIEDYLRSRLARSSLITTVAAMCDAVIQRLAMQQSREPELRLQLTVPVYTGYNDANSIAEFLRELEVYKAA